MKPLMYTIVIVGIVIAAINSVPTPPPDPGREAAAAARATLEHFDTLRVYHNCMNRGLDTDAACRIRAGLWYNEPTD